MRNAFLALVIALLATSCASVDKGMMTVSDVISSPDPVTGRREINLESEANEIQRATVDTQKLLAAAKSDGIHVDDETAQYAQVSAVFDKLKNVVHRRNLPWEVHVIDTDEWNAFTIGGGKVFLFTGLFKGDAAIQSDDELAAVLSHEMAHVAARHASEGKGKLAITQLADKDLKSNTYEASFTTNQEAEADRYSAIYMALAGYDPSASTAVWKRWHSAAGSYTGNLLYDHPLNDDRANNMQDNSQLVMQYYTPGVINENHDAILQNNAVFSRSEGEEPKAGEGGGALALLETVANAYTESMQAKVEQQKRIAKQQEQRMLASRQLVFSHLQVANAQGGGRGLFGYVTNATTSTIKESVVSVKYWNGRRLVHEETAKWSTMQPREQRQFGIPLKPIPNTAVTISPEYVLLDQD